MNLDELRIAAMASPKGSAIFLGTLNHIGTQFVEKRDVTGVCLQSVIGLVLAMPEKSIPVEVNGVPKYRITVTEIKDEKAPSAIILPPGRRA